MTIVRISFKNCLLPVFVFVFGTEKKIFLFIRELTNDSEYHPEFNTHQIKKMKVSRTFHEYNESFTLLIKQKICKVINDEIRPRNTMKINECVES